MSNTLWIVCLISVLAFFVSVQIEIDLRHRCVSPRTRNTLVNVSNVFFLISVGGIIGVLLALIWKVLQ